MNNLVARCVSGEFARIPLQYVMTKRENPPYSMPPARILQRTPLSFALWRVLALLGISVFINYIDRSNLSIAAPLLKTELHLSAWQLGVLLSSFFWTYASLQMVSGWLVDRANVGWIFAGGFFLWSAATIAMGLVHSFFLLLVLRLLLGVGESVAYPSYSKIIALHYPEEHRGMANSVISAGLALGPGFGMLLGGLLVERFGWRVFFVGLGVISMFWLVPWIKWMPPAKSTIHAAKIAAPSFADLLAQRDAWGTCLGMFGNNYISYFLLTWLPFYLVRERNFSMYEMAKIGGVAYLLGACLSLSAGWLSDRWIRAGGSPTLARKTFVAGGLAGSGIFLLLFAFSPRAYTLPLLMIGVGFQCIGSSNIWAISQTLAGPYAAGRWAGLQNFVANLAGVIAPAITGFVLQRTGHFYWPFGIVTFVTLCSAAAWIFVVGPVKPVRWKEQPELQLKSQSPWPSET
jgi:ACS family D-galactonate transporter-like MFS transporter